MKKKVELGLSIRSKLGKEKKKARKQCGEHWGGRGD